MGLGFSLQRPSESTSHLRADPGKAAVNVEQSAALEPRAGLPAADSAANCCLWRGEGP